MVEIPAYPEDEDDPYLDTTAYPPMNVIREQLGEEPKYPDDADEKRYIILYDEDHNGVGIDVEGNVAIMVDEEQAAEVERLARCARKSLEAANTQGTEGEK